MRLLIVSELTILLVAKHTTESVVAWLRQTLVRARMDCTQKLCRTLQNILVVAPRSSSNVQCESAPFRSREKLSRPSIL